MFVSPIVDHHSQGDASVEEKTRAAEEFFEALVRHLHQLRALDAARNMHDPDVTTGTLREKHGGAAFLQSTALRAEKRIAGPLAVASPTVYSMA